MVYIAHIRESDFTEQSVQTHLEGVASLAAQYGHKVGLSAHCELAGFLHDMGKMTRHFTKYLKDAALKQQISSKKIDHSTAGAKYLFDNYYGKDPIQNYVVETVGMAILSHHSGLQNFVQLDLSPSDYLRRVTNKDLPNYAEVVANFESVHSNVIKVQRLIEEAKQEFQRFMKKISSNSGTSKFPLVYLNLMQKLVFSCLIDADRTNTRCFEENEVNQLSNFEHVFKTGYHNILEQVNQWKVQQEKPINMLRNEMSESCDIVADLPPSIHQLTIPTGGGKTFASLRYALKHAQVFNKSRIIYVVPYTTILEQNAKAVRDIMKQPNAVLEHHSNVVDDQGLDSEPDYYRKNNHKKMQLGRDNWDVPILFTTMVQFLDAFYQKGTRKSRRLHNLMNSIIIFDEVQSVPYQHFPLFNMAVNFLHYVGNSSILLCTATQPAVKHMKYPIELQDNAEIISNLNKVVESFKRVSIYNHVELEGWSAERIAQFVNKIMQTSDSVLIILNTKSAVRKLYHALTELDITDVVHLSTSMCPAHRKEKLDQLHKKLDSNERIICVSTQLIEAGVDISFETVVRSLAGLDSIAQAAGRCNRNGEKEQGHVYVVKAQDEELSKLPEIKIGGEVTQNYILANSAYIQNLLSPEAIEIYFTHFDAQAQREIKKNPKDLDHELITLLDGSAVKKRPLTKSIGMFKTVEKYFEAISSVTKAVIVPYGRGKEIIACLNEEIRDNQQFNQLVNEAQQFSVNLYEHEWNILDNQKMIAPLYSDSIFFLNEKAYHEQFGVMTEGQAPLENHNY